MRLASATVAPPPAPEPRGVPLGAHLKTKLMRKLDSCTIGNGRSTTLLPRDTATQAEDLGGKGDQGDREDERDEGHRGGLARGGLRHQQRRHSPPTPHTPVRRRPRTAM
jgi:hypothetical protein